MIVKVFANRGGGSAGASIDYLLGKDRQREGAQILKGDPELSLAIAESLEFKNKYTVGCLSFEEATISPTAKKEVMARFEKMIFAGLEEDQYNITWIEHNDKGRVELNYFIPNVELTTQKRLQPYYDKVDRPMVDCFKKVINHEYGFSNPDLLEKKQLSKVNSYSPKTTKELKEVVSKFVAENISNGKITRREQIVNLLQDLDYEVVRITNKSISIKNPYSENGKNIRFSGELYEKEFYGAIENIRELGESLRETRFTREAEDRKHHSERYEHSKSELRSRIEYRSRHHQQSYSPKNDMERNPNFDHSDVVHNLARIGYLVVAEQQRKREESIKDKASSIRANSIAESNSSVEAERTKTIADRELYESDTARLAERERQYNHRVEDRTNPMETERRNGVQRDYRDSNQQDITGQGIKAFYELLERSRKYCKRIGERTKHALSAIQRADEKIRESIKGIYDSQPSENYRHRYNGEAGRYSKGNQDVRYNCTRAEQVIAQSELQINRSEQQTIEADRNFDATRHNIKDCFEQTERTGREFGATVEAVDKKVIENQQKEQERNRGWSMSR